MNFKNDDMPVQKKAKMDVLQELRRIAMQLIKEKADEGLSDGGPEAMQKVAVMAKDKEGLKKGLEKAEEVLEGMPESEEMESEEMESEESPEMSEMPEVSEDDEEAMLMQKLEELRAKKKMLK